MPELNRLKLSSYFSAASERPSILGVYDCVRFTIEALYEGWGVDYRAVLGYQDRRTAVERLRISGGLEQAFSAELGEPINPALLLPGDIAFFYDPAIGIVMHSYIAVKFKGTIGRIPLQLSNKGWHSWVRY